MPAHRTLRPSAAGQRPPHKGTHARALHDRVLSEIPKPAYFIQDSLLEDTYIIQTEDPESYRRATVKVPFRSPVAPGPVWLTDDANVSDLLIAKLAIIYALDRQRGWAKTASSMPAYLSGILTLIRWRNAQGIHRFRELIPEFFTQYVECLAERGPKYLLPFEERIAGYLEEVRAGRASLPISSDGLQSNKIARLLGVSLRVQIPNDLWRPIAEELKSTNIKAYDKAPVNLFDEPDRQHVPQIIFANLRPWGDLWNLRDVLAHDPLPFEPWDERESAWSLACSLTERVAERTDLPPPKQTCYLLNAALDFVQNSSGPILRLLGEYGRLFADEKLDDDLRRQKLSASVERLRNEYEPGQRPRWLSELSGYRFSAEGQQRGVKKSGLFLRDIAYRLLPGACAVVLAGFTARRRAELQSLRDDCLFNDEYGRLFISSWAAKHLRRVDAIPAPACSRKVVEVLAELSERGRAVGENHWLFNFKEMNGTTAWPRLENAIQGFAAFADLPPLDDGSQWTPLPHQFRVFFSTTYYYRFHHPSLTALSRYLKHNDTDITRTYVTSIIKGNRLAPDDERLSAERSRSDLKARTSATTRRNDFEEVRRAFLRDTVLGIADGTITVGGAGGRQWTADLQALVRRAGENARFSLTQASTSPDTMTFSDLLNQWITAKSLEPHPQGFGFCKCSGAPGDLVAAACLKAKAIAEGVRATDNSGPDLAYASDETCIECPHQLTLTCNDTYWEEAELEAENVAAKGATLSERTGAQRRLAKIRRHRSTLHADLVILPDG